MKPPKILIVEDELLIAQNVSRKLKKMGYEVVDIVSSGEMAVQTAIEQHPNLVLMDIVIQGEMDGIDAATKIREQCHIPVIYLTAYADEKTLERAKLTEPLGYILKPFKDRDLRVTIEIALSRHQAELEVQKALHQAEVLREAAEADNQRKNQQISMVSHEFRSPLSVIQMTAELLQEYGEMFSDDARDNHLRRIRNATESMNQLLEDVLTLGKLEAKTLQPVSTPLSVIKFCRELIEALQLSRTNECVLQLCNLVGELEVYIEEKLLWHILNNLLTNGMKYSPNGGVVSLTVSRVADQICFQVQDQGIGISELDQKRLFEPFQRASNVGNIPGTGLGLAIVKHLVDLHDGTIDVKSQLGVGTLFSVTLPTHPHSDHSDALAMKNAS